MIQYVQKSFKQLTSYELYELLKLRQQVFIVEQECAYPDIDKLDLDAIHIFGITSSAIVSYARILAPGVVYPMHSSIGRVVNDPSVRGAGIGKKLMKYTIEICKSSFPDHSIKISAQVYLNKFYSELGFIPSGQEYLEDGIPHIAMILK